MTNGHWTDRLSEHIDGDLGAVETAACEAHLSTCAECSRALEELRALTAQASLLPDVPPGRDLWPDIEARLRPRAFEGDPQVRSLAASRRRVALTVPQLAAAAIALVFFSLGGAWVAAGAGRAPSPPATALVEPADGGGAGATAPVLFAGSYQAAITQLETEFERRRADLDPATVRVVEENLAIIDAAISDAGQALSGDPASAFLSTHLANALRQKVDLLRQVATIQRVES